MTPFRRQMLKAALAGAVILATPASLYAAARRGGQRFLWIRLRRRNSFLSIDTQANDRAYLITKQKALTDGSYPLRNGGVLVVKGGRITGRTA